ncbi:MAG: hypothetical protein LBM77_07440 [Spirochaetaceae bacterium]|jgi:heptaprenyl diphosphate synthase|nr:hypothetical protein [Spirochaetaceae bacterium]
MKKFESFRLRRSAFFYSLFSAKALALAGLLAMPAFVFCPSTPLRILQFLFFWFAAWLSGKKNNPLITLAIILGIVLFNLIVPYGQVLYTIGPFQITGGALGSGIHRAVTLEGLIMLSRIAVRRDLKLPGFFGEIIADSFKIYADIEERRHKVQRKNILKNIDNLMLELSQAEDETTTKSQNKIQKTSIKGWLILATGVLIAWGLYFLHWGGSF